MDPSNTPLYPSQWHFDLLGDVEAIWTDHTGSGVAVVVFDDGVEAGHADITGNYNQSGHYSGTGSDDGAPNTASDAHGTAVAGLIGAANNGVGGLGVAWNASLTGVDYLNDIQYQSNTIISEALRHAASFDVMNNSWGSTPYYLASQNIGIDGDLTMLAADFSHVADTGRGGLGTIVVKAAGNDANNATLQSNYRIYGNAQGEGTNNVAAAIIVGATDSAGFGSSYSNFGNNLLISAPAAAVTTDRSGIAGYDDGDYTHDFSGTSASTPVVSGVAALMIDANEGLGWRDVHNIMAVSAAHTGSDYGNLASGYEHAAWFANGADHWNGGGVSFNMSYGFGMIDAFAAVRMAEVWTTLHGAAATSANQQSVTVQDSTSRFIKDFQTTTYIFNITENLLVEHIYVELDAYHSWMGDLKMWVTGPNGESFELFDLERGAADLGDWTFSITSARGMTSAGEWTFNIRDMVSNDAGMVYGVDLKFLGSAVSADTVHHFTDDFLSYASVEAARTTIADTDGGNDWLNLVAVTGHVGVALQDDAQLTVGGTNWAQLVNGSAIENIAAGDGNDMLTGSVSSNHILGMRGNDILSGDAGHDTVDGGAGDDTINGGAGRDLIDGGSGADSLEGGTAADTMQGGAGHDSMVGGTGRDTLYGGDGDDTIYGNSAADLVFGDDGNDWISLGDRPDIGHGGNGQDTILGRTGADTLFGDEGADELFGAEGQDHLDGGTGSDTLNGGTGDDTLIGGDGNDRLYGNLGADVIQGDAGKDRLFGAGGNDTLLGGADNDIINGSSGVDELHGGMGDDTLTGGSEADTFVFTKQSGADIITDFSVTEDMLYFSSALVGGAANGAAILSRGFAQIDGIDVLFNFDDDHYLRLVNVTSIIGLDSAIVIV